MFVEQAGIEDIDAGGDGSVRGEDVADAGGFEGLIEGEAVFLHEDADALDGKEGGVAFVHVVDGWLDAEFGERAQAADAKDDFLADAFENVAAVELIGDFAVFGGAVLRDVGIENVELDAADVDAPDLDEELAGGEVDADDDFVAVVVKGGAHGESVEVVERRAFLLPAIGVEVLLKITALVEKADAGEGEVGIAGAFHVIAGEEAEAAGVNLHAIEQAVLHGKVGDAGGSVGGDAGVEIGVVALAGAFVEEDEARVGGGAV